MKDMRENIPLDSPEMIDYRLKQEEQLINLKILHKMDRESCAKKQNRFRRTVLAVHNIVSQKLYKRRASSVEVYFRDAWRISRAQVYRFLDCAEVLKQLADFPEQPCKERLCRSLKRLAHNRENIRILWVSVLKRVTKNNQAVTSTVISSVWEELLKNKVVSIQKESRTRRSGDKNKNSNQGFKPETDKDLPEGQDTHESGYDLKSQKSTCAVFRGMYLNDKSFPQGTTNGGLNDKNNLQAYGKDSNSDSVNLNEEKEPLAMQQWSNKSPYPVDDLYQRGAMCMGEEYQLSNQKMTPVLNANKMKYIFCDNEPWSEINSVKNKPFIQQPLNHKDQTQSLHVNLPLEEKPQVFGGLTSSSVSSPELQTLNRNSAMMSGVMHHNVPSYPTSPLLLDLPKSGYKPEFMDNCSWPMSIENSFNSISKASIEPHTAPAGCMSPDPISHYCCEYPSPIDTYKHQKFQKPTPERENVNFMGSFCQQNTTQEQSMKSSDPFSKNNSWMNTSPYYMMFQNKPDILPKTQLPSEQYDKIQPCETQQPLKKEYGESTSEFNIGNGISQMIDQDNSIESPRTQYDGDYNMYTDMLWRPLGYNKFRINMDHCGRTFFGDFCHTDPLLYCNN